MSKGQGEDKKWDLKKVAQAVAPICIGTIPWLIGCGWDIVYVTVTIAFIILPPAIYPLGRKVQKESPILTESGEPWQKPLVPISLRRLAWLLPTLSLLQLAVVWFFLWDWAFPIASLAQFRGSLLKGSNDLFLQTPPVIVYLPNGTKGDACHALEVNVYKSPLVKRVLVHDIRLVGRKTDYKYQIVYGVVPKNFAYSFTFNVVFPKNGGSTSAQLHDQGKTIGGIIYFDTDNPFGTFHLNVHGKDDKPAVYSVVAEVDVSDEQGNRRRTLRTAPVLAFVYPDTP